MNHEDDFQLEPQDRVWKDAFREAIHAESEQPASFWTSQRAAIRGRITSRDRRSSVRMAFASVAALCLFAALLLSGVRPSTAPTGQLPNHVATVQTDSDKLLSEVQETIDNPMPDSFAPIDLLAQDMDKQFNANEKFSKQ